MTTRGALRQEVGETSASWSGQRMPALFIGHGAPTLVDDATWVGELRDLVGQLPRPRAVLVVSAHWEAAPMMVGATRTVPLVHDFGGFPARYAQVTYPAPGAPALADAVAGLVPAGQELVRTDRGLDHGAYVPLTIMYPDADVPVLQVSLPTLRPEPLLALGRRLRELRDHGVLVVASGFTTHGLPHLSRAHWLDTATPPPGWSAEFDAWAREALEAGDLDTLSAFRDRAPGMPYAHPTTEHLAPMFVALGMADHEAAPPEQVIDGYWMGLSKRSLVVR